MHYYYYYSKRNKNYYSLSHHEHPKRELGNDSFICGKVDNIVDKVSMNTDKSQKNLFYLIAKNKNFKNCVKIC